MSTFEDLEREVGKLRKEVNRLRGNSAAANRAAVNEIVGGANEPPERRGGFAKACAESRATAHAALRDKAITELNSGRILTPFDVGSFLEVYGGVADINVLLAEHRAGNKVR